MQASRASLFRLLGDEDRLRLLALCSEEELTVSELATLLSESQPQVTKKTQPLREAGLLTARRDGTRTLLRTEGRDSAEPIMAAAMSEGRTLCARDGSLARIATVVAQREELSRRFFDAAPAPTGERFTTPDASLLSYLAVFAPLLPGNALAVDLGTGDGQLLPMLSPVFDRVIAVDRSPARLARCAARVTQLGLPNVRLREGDADDADLAAEVAQRGGADIVMMVRVLHHAARPDDTVAAAARLLRRGGHLIIVDYVPHSDETMRAQGDVWLGFDPDRLRTCIEQAGLDTIALSPLATPSAFVDEDGTTLPAHQVAIGRRAVPHN